MDPDSWLSLLLVLILLVISGWFAACETALSSANRTRIRLMTERGDRRAVRADRLLDRFDRTLSSLLIGNNLAHILASSVTTVWAVRRFGSASAAVATLILTLVVFFFAELLPKNLAKKYAVGFSCACSGLLNAFCVLCTPFSWLLSSLGRLVSRATGDEASVTEDEFHDMVETMTEESALDEEKGELVQSALHFSDRTAGDILTARVDMVAVSDSWDSSEILETVKKARLSRLPVYHGTVDTIVGILSCRNYIRAYRKGAANALRSLLDAPLFVHGSMPIDSLLAELNHRKQNMAVVTDDYGGVEGIVTVEDILEELVGEIWDEDDVAVESLQADDGGGFLIDAGMAAQECLEEMSCPLTEEQEQETAHRTIGSLAFILLEKIPAEGDSFDYAGMTFTVEKMRRQRILTLRAVPAAPEEVTQE